MTHQANILVVEDRSDWQKIILRLLAKENFRPELAASLEAAITTLKTKKFDLAILDIVLDDTRPRFDRAGLTVVSKVRETQGDIPIIVVSGFLAKDVNASLSKLCPEAPIFLKESFDRSKFIDAIYQLLGEQQTLKPTRAEDIAPGPGEDTRPLPTPPPLAKAASRPCVLLVENQTSWQKIVTEILDKAGYFWRVAGNASEALQILGEISFHLIILDLKLQENELPLPSSEGWRLLDYMVETQFKTKVVILSGEAKPDEAVKLVTQYPIIIDFIEKQNFSPQKIIDAVNQATQVPELRIQSFGQFRIWRDGQLIGVWERPQAEILVKLLLIRRARQGHTVAADELITYLWPDADEESGRKKLLPLISNARRTLEPDIESRHSNFIVRDANGYYFELSDQVTWDLLEFHEHLRCGRRSAREKRWTEAIIELEKGRALYQGDFMEEDRYADWAIDIRREITNDFLELLVPLADAYALTGHYHQAIAVCETALQKDPLLESVYRRLMRLHYCNGEKGQALKVYRDCLTLFEELFGESPTPPTRQLREAIANDQPVEYELEWERESY